MKKSSTSFVFILPLLLAGCALTSDDTAVTSLDSDPRVGEEVRQVCSTRSIHSWANVDNDRNAVILVMRNRDAYKLKLSGGCDPDWAMTHLQVITRPGASCFSRGDTIRTDADVSGSHASACIISGINRWNPEAANVTETQPEARQQPEQ